jgi:hypothetical protein
MSHLIKSTAGIALVALLAVMTLALMSCATDQGTATPGYYSPAAPGSPGAKFGILIVPRIPSSEEPVIIQLPAK